MTLQLRGANKHARERIRSVVRALNCFGFEAKLRHPEDRHVHVARLSLVAPGRDIHITVQALRGRSPAQMRVWIDESLAQYGYTYDRLVFECVSGDREIGTCIYGLLAGMRDDFEVPTAFKALNEALPHVHCEPLPEEYPHLSFADKLAYTHGNATDMEVKN